jgi:hypothetical protein
MVAAAIAAFAEITLREIAANRANPRNANSLDDARIITQGPSREFTLGLCYDFAHNFMDTARRDKVRQALVETTAGMTGIGCETLGTLHTGTSNWISWGARALFAICAIEGEPGYDVATFRRFADAQINFINALHSTGEAFEGWGKNFLFLEHLVILAKRGEHLNILGHTGIRAAYRCILSDKMHLTRGMIGQCLICLCYGPGLQPARGWLGFIIRWPVGGDGGALDRRESGRRARRIRGGRASGG